MCGGGAVAGARLRAAEPGRQDVDVRVRGVGGDRGLPVVADPAHESLAFPARRRFPDDRLPGAEPAGGDRLVARLQPVGGRNGLLQTSARAAVETGAGDGAVANATESESKARATTVAEPETNLCAIEASGADVVHRC